MLFLGTGSRWGNEAALAKDKGTGHPCCQLLSLFPSVVLASNPTGSCTKHSMTCGNFNPFSFAHTKTGWHRPPALQPPASKNHQRSCSAVISSPHTLSLQQKPHSMQINHSTTQEQQLCPTPSLARAAWALQPVYPDFNQQLQLLQHRRVSRNSSTQEVKEHAGQLRCRAKALAVHWVQQSQRRRNVLQGRSLCPAPGKVPPAGGSHSQHREWLPARSKPASASAASYPDIAGPAGRETRENTLAQFSQKKFSSPRRRGQRRPSFEDTPAALGHGRGELAGGRAEGFLGTVGGCCPCSAHTTRHGISTRRFSFTPGPRAASGDTTDHPDPGQGAVLRAGGCSCDGEDKQSPRTNTSRGRTASTGTVTLCKLLLRGKGPNEQPLPCLGATEGQEVALAPLPLLRAAVPAKASCSCREMEQQVSVQL